MKKKTAPDARLPLFRMTKLHQLMLDRKYPNCRKMAAMFEVSSKTIQRDIEYMRDVFALPIEYDSIERGFYYSGEVVEFPTIQVSEGEMAALFLVRHVLELYEGTTMMKPLSQAFARITESLNERIRFQWEEIGDRIAYRNIDVPEERLQMFESLSQAVLRCQRITFNYKGVRDRTYKKRDIHPYQQVCWSGNWYLVGWDNVRKDWRIFSFKRIRDLKIKEDTFERKKEFQSELFWGETFGVYRGKGSERIRIRFTDWAARLVTETTWHGSQKIHNLGDGRVEVCWQMQLTPDFLRWVLSWGSQAEVLEPKSLKEKVREEAKRMVK